MESHELSVSGTPHFDLHAGRGTRRLRLRDASVVLQVDGALSAINGLGWLTARRDEEAVLALTELQLEAMANSWSAEEFARARLHCLRPRRAELNELGAAYLAAITPGAVNAAHRLRRAGVTLELSGEVAVEAMLRIADALGVTPDGILAPRVRFDALGAFTGCDAAVRRPALAHEYGPADPGRVFVGTRTSELLASGDRDLFIRYTGVVAHEGPNRAESVGSFAELAALVAV